MKNEESNTEAKFFQETLHTCLGWPNMFSPPACLEFSLCALLDSWTLLWYGLEGKETWRKFWKAERQGLHGSHVDRFLSDPVNEDRSLFLTYSTHDLLNQSYCQVTDAIQHMWIALQNHYVSDDSTPHVKKLQRTIDPLIRDALKNPSLFGQPAGLEGYASMTLTVFESLMQAESSPNVMESVWQEEIETIQTDVPIHVRRLRDVLPKSEKYQRERAIPPNVWAECQQQTVTGFENILQHLWTIYPQMEPVSETEPRSI